MKASTWIIVGLGLVIALLIWFWPQTGTSDREKEIERDNISLLYKIDSLAKLNRATLNEAKEDSLRGVQIQDSLRTQANRFRGQVVKLKASPIVIRVREEVPVVDSLIVAQDSVIANQGYAIAAYEHQLGKLQINVGAITQNFEKALELERERYANATEIIALKDKELKKEKRKVRLAKILVPVTAVAGFLLGLQL